MNDDDNKQLNTTDASEETHVDVTPVGEEVEEATPEQAEVISEELATEVGEEMKDSDTTTPSVDEQEAEEDVQEEVDEENAHTAEDLGVSDENNDEESEDEKNEEQDSEQDQNESTTDASTAPVVNDNPNARWYVVHTYSGHENRVATNLRQRIETEGLEHKIVDILVPTQDKIEIRSGKKEQVKEKVFPGYILVKMELGNETWLAVRTTQGVISFVGAGSKPLPISEAEVKSIVQFMNQGAAPTFKEVFLVDDTVKIIDGPFADFIGKVESVDKEKGKLRVLVSIFGRETPVELDFLQVSKL